MIRMNTDDIERLSKQNAPHKQQYVVVLDNASIDFVNNLHMSIYNYRRLHFILLAKNQIYKNKRAQYHLLLYI